MNTNIRLHCGVRFKQIASVVMCLFILYFLVFFSPACKKKKEEVADAPIVSQEKAEKPQAKTGPDKLDVSTYPRDGRHLRNLEQPLIVFFSRKVEADDFLFKVSPDPGKWDQAWEDGGEIVILHHGNPFRKDTDYKLELEIKSARIKKEIHFSASGPSSLELLDKAEKEGLLDLDTVWTYRLQALMDPAQLPPEYQSSAPFPCGTTILRDFKEVKADLKPETLQKLHPYLVRPTHPDSVFSRIENADAVVHQKQGFRLFPQVFAQDVQEKSERPTSRKGLTHWRAIKSFEYPIKVWSPRTEKKAQEALNIIESSLMYDTFSTLLERVPLSDIDDKPDNGGDNYLDIYLTPLTKKEREKGILGFCHSIQGGTTSPAWILIDHSLSGDDLESTLAHELFHAFQFAFNQLKDDWWMEGTAVWAQNYENRGHNLEQDYIPDAYLPGLNRLETMTNNDGLHPYGIYLFPYHLSSEYGDKIIADIWTNCVSEFSLKAIEKSLKGKDFDDCFKEFALHNADVGKHKGYYTDSGGQMRLFPHHKEKKEDIAPGDLPVLAIDMTIPPLSAVYYRLENKCKPEATPHLLFDLEEFARNEKLTIQAIIDPDSKAEDQDWSELKEKHFCINSEEEKFKNITLVVASSEQKSVLFPTLVIFMDAEGCDATYATITRRDYAINESSDSTQEWEKEAKVYLSFDTAIKSPIFGPSGAKQLIMYPIKSVRFLEGHAQEKYESPRKKELRQDKTMRALKPALPEVQMGNQMLNPVFLMLFSDPKTGEVEYVYLPPIPVKILWNDGKEEEFSVRGVSSSDEASANRPGLISSDYLVKSGDGASKLGGNGLDEYTQRGATTYEYSKKTFEWEITRRNVPAKKK